MSLFSHWISRNLRQIFTKTEIPKASTLYHVNAIAISKEFGFQVLKKPVLVSE